MRSHSDAVRSHQTKSVERFEKIGASIRQQLDCSATYPWLDLTTLRPEKFFSDIIESLIGAIYVDSKGSLEYLEVRGRDTSEEVIVAAAQSALYTLGGNSRQCL